MMPGRAGASRDVVWDWHIFSERVDPLGNCVRHIVTVEGMSATLSIRNTRMMPLGAEDAAAANQMVDAMLEECGRLMREHPRYTKIVISEGRIVEYAQGGY